MDEQAKKYYATGMEYKFMVVTLNKGETVLKQDVSNLSWSQQCRKVDVLRKQIPACRELRKMACQPIWGRRMMELGPEGKREWNFDNQIELI